MILCQNCEHQNNDGAVFCKNCGNKLLIPEKSMTEDTKHTLSFCYNCGAQIGNVNFCPSCGTQIGKTKKSVPIETVLKSKDYTNQSVYATLNLRENYYLSGNIFFSDNFLKFKTNAMNFEQFEVTMEYKSIKKIDFVKLNAIYTGIQIEMNSDDIYKFWVKNKQNRQQIKDFLENKRL